MKRLSTTVQSALKRTAQSAFIFLLLTPACRAGIVQVDSSDDTAGYSTTLTLRDAITVSNNDSVDTTIHWRYTGGTITLGSDLPYINGVTTLDVSDAASAVAIYSPDDDYTLGLGGTVTIKNDNTATPVTLAVILTSTGSLTKDGDGILYLTKDNTYSGGTIFKKGIISITDDSNLGAAAGNLTFDGGILQLRDSISTARSIILNAGGGTMDTNNSYTLYLTGIISGAGGLTKIHDGTLVLSGANTYTGGTTVSSGTLIAAADNTLPSGGGVTTAAGTSLILGSYKQHIDSYSGSGNLSITLRTDAIPNLEVTNTAALGGTLTVGITPRTVLTSPYTVITAAAITGTFDSIISPAAVLFTPTYNSGSLVLTATMVPFTSIAATANQKAAGAALEPLRAGASGDLATVMGNLYTLDTAALAHALDQLGPVSLASMRGLALQGSELRSAALEARAADLAAGRTEVFSTYLSNEEDRTLDFMDYSEAIKRTAEPGAAKKTSVRRASPGRRPWSLFAAAGGISGKVMRNDTSAENTPGYEFTQGALNAGFDLSLGEHLTAGVLAGYSAGSADVNIPSSAEVDSKSARYGAYAAGSMGALRLTLYAGRAADSFKTERKIVFGEISRKASASPSGKETNLQADASYDFGTGTRLGRMGPFIRGSYDRLDTDAFTETGADSMNLSVGAITARSLRSSAGFRYSDGLDAGGGAMVKTSINVSWDHEYQDQSLPLTAAFAAGGAAFAVNSGDTARDAVKFGARVSAGSESGALTGWLGYAGEARKRYYSHAVTTGLALKF